jgi:hypothetical protein
MTFRFPVSAIRFPFVEFVEKGAQVYAKGLNHGAGINNCHSLRHQQDRDVSSTQRNWTKKSRSCTSNALD